MQGKPYANVGQVTPPRLINLRCWNNLLSLQVKKPCYLSCEQVGWVLNIANQNSPMKLWVIRFFVFRFSLDSVKALTKNKLELGLPNILDLQAACVFPFGYIASAVRQAGIVGQCCSKMSTNFQPVTNKKFSSSNIMWQPKQQTFSLASKFQMRLIFIKDLRNNTGLVWLITNENVTLLRFHAVLLAPFCHIFLTKLAMKKGNWVRNKVSAWNNFTRPSSVMT